jgi:hypothetical protein
MLDIANNGIIRVSRGDSFRMPLFIDCGTPSDPMRYTVGTKDEVYFGVMEANQPFEYALIKKKYTIEDVNEDGDVVIEFTPEDTLMVIPDLYYYQVKVRLYNANTNDYEVHTVVPKTKFFIEE